MHSHWQHCILSVCDTKNFFAWVVTSSVLCQKLHMWQSWCPIKHLQFWMEIKLPCCEEMWWCSLAKIAAIEHMRRCCWKDWIWFWWYFRNYPMCFTTVWYYTLSPLDYFIPIILFAWYLNDTTCLFNTWHFRMKTKKHNRYWKCSAKHVYVFKQQTS